MPSPLLSALTAAPGPHPPLAELRAYAAGELTGSAAHQVEAHTLACARCADVLEGLQLTPPATTNRLLIDLGQRLHLRVKELDQRPDLVPVVRFRAWPRLAAAAVLVAGLGAGIWGWQHQAPAARKVPQLAVRAIPAPAGSVSAPAGATATEAPSSASAAVVARHPVVAVAPNFPDRLLTRKANRPASRSAAAAQTVDKDFAMADEKAPATVPPLPAEAAEAGWTRAKQADSLQIAGRSNYEAATTTDAATAKKQPAKARMAALAANAPAEAALPAAASAAVVAPPVASAAPAAADGTMNLRSLSEVSAPHTRAALPPPPILEPRPAGGYQALRTYLRKQAAEFVPDAHLGPVKGVVRVRFTVSAAGKPELEQAKILLSLRPDYDAEVLRLLAEGPAWVPGIAAGRRAALPVQVEVLF